MRDYTFGDRLSALRQENGYSQFQLANLIGVSDKAVSKWETGVAKPRMKTCQRLAAVLGVDLGDLFNQSEHNTSIGGYIMNKEKLWAAAEENLYSLYGNEPDFTLINRFKTEKNFLRDTDAIVLFTALAHVRRLADEHQTLINVRGPINGSFTAWLTGATIINPLPAHTRCPKCHKVSYYPDVMDGWDLSADICSCGHSLIRDGHNLPFETYLDKVKTNFCTIDCLVSSEIITEAWKEILSMVRNDYTCDRYVFQQAEETGLPGQFSRLYLHPGNIGKVFESINDVPEISNAMTRSRYNTSSILLLESKMKGLKYKTIPSIDDLIVPDVLQYALKKNCSSQYCLSNISLFHDLVQAEAASHATFKEGFDIVQFAADNGLSSFIDLPLTREEIWIMITKASKDIPGIANDMLHNIRLGKFARGTAACDTALMKRIGLPKWFPEYASSILYLFPKSHCVDFAYRNLIEVWQEMNM